MRGDNHIALLINGFSIKLYIKRYYEMSRQSIPNRDAQPGSVSYSGVAENTELCNQYCKALQDRWILQASR